MLCKCGSTKSSKLKLGLCSSCYSKHWRATNSVKVKKYLSSTEDRFRKAKQKANLRKISWHLSLEEFSVFCNQPCYYCNNLIGKVVEFGSGLDRLDNNVGYIASNIVSCCSECNKIRNEALTSEEMKKVAEFIISIRK